jgi:cyclic beta-1,2-glucan synthetase
MNILKKAGFIWALLIAGLVQATPMASFYFIDAGQQGTFNVGEAQATVERVFDNALQREVLNIAYSVSGNAAAGVWSKQYPEELVNGSANLIDVSINVLKEKQLSEITARIELKGSSGMQTFNVPLQLGWSSIQETIDWGGIGDLDEAVLLIQRIGGDDPAEGVILLDVSYSSMGALEKFNASKAGQLTQVLLVALLSMLVSFVKVKPVKGLGRDLLLGLATTLIFAVVFGICRLASIPSACALAGVAIGVLLKLSIVGKSLTKGEAFRNALFTGLLAATASSSSVWQAPSVLSSYVQLSAFGAALFALIYHVANAYRLSAFKKHLGSCGAVVISATPFAFGLLLAVQNAGTIWMQAILVFAFAEFIANAASLITRQKPLADVKVHNILALFSVAVVVAPLVADLGSMALPAIAAPFAAVAATMLSQAPLWGLVFLLTGMTLDAIRGGAPAFPSAKATVKSGAIKGAVFSGVLMGLLQMIHLIGTLGIVGTSISYVVIGAVAFPLAKTIIETFDGSQSFFGRAAGSYKDPVLWARGIVAGLAFAIGLNIEFASLETGIRIGYGALFGAAVFGGVSLMRDIFYGFKSWRYYLIEGGLGAFIGAGLGFYFDASQLPIITTKIKFYTSFGLEPNTIVGELQALRTTAPHEFTALVSRWGHIRLSPAAGGAKMLFNEALMGVIGWGIAAPLFAINKAFLAAIINKDASSIKRIPTRDGVAELVDGTVHVLRWGLWMAPIIFTFLRPMANATWYNQDGLIRTFFAIFNNLAQDSAGFTAWSLTVFSWVIGFAWFQVLIWLDHMGLRVATLVNLSFLGMDKLDERCATFVGKDATARFIPEGVKRFTTWAPLLIPFYLPKGQEWDQVFSQGLALQANAGQFPFGWISVAAVFVVATIITASSRIKPERNAEKLEKTLRLSNNSYAVELKKSGELNSVLTTKGYGITRPAFENVEPAGRILYVLDADTKEAWPILGNFPEELFTPSTFSQEGDVITVVNESNEVRATVKITLPNREDAVELWDVKVEDLSNSQRNLKVVPYLEWMIHNAGTDRNHSQYNRLYPEMSYHTDMNAILSLHRYTKYHGILASSVKPEGILSGRVDFIGRAGSVWAPRVFQTLDFQPALNMDAYPSFDPIGAMLIDASEPLKIMIGCCETKATASGWIYKYLDPSIDTSLADQNQPERHPLIGHGEILPGTPDNYTEYVDNGNTLRVLTPFTPRPFDHEMSNSLGHVLAVTNRGLHSTTNGNAQQNRLTSDWADVTGSQMPAEAIYLYDEQSAAWFSPTYDPIKDNDAKHDVLFGLDGSGTFKMKKGEIETELSVHVPLDEPAGVYILKIRNTGSAVKKLRVAPYFQIALAHSPEMAGKLKIDRDAKTGAMYFENPRNSFREGSCFVAMSANVETFTTKRGEFFGKGRTFAHPAMVEGGAPQSGTTDEFAVAAMTTTVEVPAGGEQSISIVLGQGDNRKQAEAVVKKFKSVETGEKSLEATREWWLALQSTLELETSDKEFDAYVKWMKYQALAERIWARKGFYQASGAFGFRDQLQDTVNMIWVDPKLARTQLKLHASQQFPEGDVVHWFFRQQDGRSGFLCRSHAYDNLLWLGWGVAEYTRMTGDKTLLDEKVTYLKAETPLLGLPEGKHGMGFYPLRSPKGDSIFEHVLKAFDCVFEKRLGPNGLPLIGAGDWNDGLDEIGSEGRGESVWLAFFLTYILKNFLHIIEERSGKARRDKYEGRMKKLEENIEKVWRGDRYLRAIHDDGTEIGVEGAGYWETDALGAAWAVYADVNPERNRIAVDTAIKVLERDNVVSLGFPPLREDTKPYLGRSSRYPEGVRENGMYSHGVQWLTRACRLLAERFAAQGDAETAQHYRDACARIWYKVSAISHVTREEIEIYGGQPNKQCADYLTKYDQGRMIWNGYTGAAAWMLRQACESVIGATLVNNEVVMPNDLELARGELTFKKLMRDVTKSPLK